MVLAGPEEGAPPAFDLSPAGMLFAVSVFCAIQGIERSNAANGLANSPLGTRRVDDFRIRSTQGAGDNFLQQLQGFMQPLGSKTNSAGVWGGKG